MSDNIPFDTNKKSGYRIRKTFSFAYHDGYEALEWLESQADANDRGGMSAYIIKLLLEDKYMKTKTK